MLDVTSIVTKAVVPAETGRSKASAPVSDGQEPPVSGNTVPVEAKAKAEPPELPELERLAESISQFAQSMNRDLTFSVHEASGKTVVKVLDGETKEIIRQIPSEEFRSPREQQLTAHRHGSLSRRRRLSVQLELVRIMQIISVIAATRND